MKAYLLVFATVFLAELGDKTQLAALVYATDPAVGRTAALGRDRAAQSPPRAP